MSAEETRTSRMLQHLNRVLASPKVRPLGVATARKLSLQTTSSASVGRRQFSEYQQSLPKLPVPSLKQTMTKFLETVRPLVSGDEFKHTENLVSDFLKPGSASHKLQSLLEQRAQTADNWLSDWWLNIAYLEFRIPVMINISPGILLPLQNFRGLDGQIQTAAKVISGALDYKKKLDNHELQPDKLGGNPLCMQQYYLMLNTCRVPGNKRDSVVSYGGDHPDPPKHVTVIRNNHFFSVPVYGSDGRPLSTTQVIEQLKRVVEQSSSRAPPVGILTTNNRDSWHKAYSAMCKNKKNKANFEDIQKSIVVVCLDQSLPNDNPYDLDSAYLRQANNGGGSKSNTANRWFDKTLQVIVGPDGFVGGTYEHATAEGPPILSILDHITTNFVQKDIPTEDTATGVVPPTHLQFEITPEVNTMIESSAEAADSLINDLDMAAFNYSEYGTKFIKSHKLSPDAFLQVAFQLAFYKLYGHSTATYESGSLRKFQRGRTETIRSCTDASHAYCQAMQDPDATVSDKVAKLRDAVAAHRKYTDEVMKGNGIDRHILGLKLTAIENGLDLPKLFMDPVFESSCYWRISTSQVASKANGVLGFGPVVPDGYGICYNPMSDSLFFALSAWNSCPTTNTNRIKQSLKDALKDAQDILVKSQGGNL